MMTSSATTEQASFWDSPASVELGCCTHSNGYDLQEVENGLFLVSGLDMGPALLRSWTRDQIQKEWPNGGLFRYVRGVRTGGF